MSDDRHERARHATPAARRALALGHEVGWATTPGGKRYATCACGWRAPVRGKLTHAISDARDHVYEVGREGVSLPTDVRPAY